MDKKEYLSAYLKFPICKKLTTELKKLARTLKAELPKSFVITDDYNLYCMLKDNNNRLQLKNVTTKRELNTDFVMIWLATDDYQSVFDEWLKIKDINSQITITPIILLSDKTKDEIKTKLALKRRCEEFIKQLQIPCVVLPEELSIINIYRSSLAKEWQIPNRNVTQIKAKLSSDEFTRLKNINGRTAMLWLHDINTYYKYYVLDPMYKFKINENIVELFCYTDRYIENWTQDQVRLSIKCEYTKDNDAFSCIFTPIVYIESLFCEDLDKMYSILAADDEEKEVSSDKEKIQTSYEKLYYIENFYRSYVACAFLLSLSGLVDDKNDSIAWNISDNHENTISTLKLADIYRIEAINKMNNIPVLKHKGVEDELENAEAIRNELSIPPNFTNNFRRALQAEFLSRMKYNKNPFIAMEDIVGFLRRQDESQKNKWKPTLVELQVVIIEFMLQENIIQKSVIEKKNALYGRDVLYIGFTPGENIAIDFDEGNRELRTKHYDYFSMR